jgi:hypothetical protein
VHCILFSLANPLVKQALALEVCKRSVVVLLCTYVLSLLEHDVLGREVVGVPERGVGAVLEQQADHALVLVRVRHRQPRSQVQRRVPVKRHRVHHTAHLQGTQGGGDTG